MKAFVLCLLIGGSGVGYVWQKSQISELGTQIRKCEQQVGGLQEQNEKLQRQLAIMLSPRFLEERAKELNLGLVPPQPSQIWRLPEPAVDWSEPTRETQFVAQGTQSLTRR